MSSQELKHREKAPGRSKATGTAARKGGLQSPASAATQWLHGELSQTEVAVARGTAARNRTPHAVRAVFNQGSRTVNVGLSNGAAFTFPVGLVEKLADAADDALAGIELTPLGTGLHWPALDVDLTVEGLLLGVFGSLAWMRQQAALAGRASSEAKAAAARANGTRGGRPRKQGLVAA